MQAFIKWIKTKCIPIFLALMIGGLVILTPLLPVAAFSTDNPTSLIQLQDKPAFFSSEWPIYPEIKFQGISPCEICWLFSFLIPGFGQLLMGDAGKAILFAILVWPFEVLFIFFAPQFVDSLTSPNYPESLPELAQTVTGYITGIIALFFIPLYTWNIVDAYFLSHPSPKEQLSDLERMKTASSQEIDSFYQQCVSVVQIAQRIRLNKASVHYTIFEF